MRWYRQFRFPHGTAAFVAAYAAAVLLLIGSTVYAGRHFAAHTDDMARQLADISASQQSQTLPVTASAVLQDFDWGPSARSVRRLPDAGGGADRRYSSRARRDDDDDDDDDDDEQVRVPQYSSSYRTVCVRLCDGSFFPVGYGVDPSRFALDALSCTSSCDAPAKLFVYHTVGEDIDQAVDLRGQPYTRLKTAFLYRQTYNEACRCKPQPWAQASLERHKVYGLETAARKGDKAARDKLAKARSELRVVETVAREQIRADAEKAYTDVTGQPSPTVAEQQRPERQFRFGGRSDGEADVPEYGNPSRYERPIPRQEARVQPGRPPEPMRLGAAREKPVERKSPGQFTGWERKVYDQ